MTLASLVARPALAEQHFFHRYTRADGLTGTAVSWVFRDSRGFLWLGTNGGASRFDGRNFETYKVRDAEVVHAVNAIIETRDGSMWMATNGGGVARLDPGLRRRRSQEPALVRYRVGDARATNRVNSLAEDRDGRVWAATDAGLFRLSESGERFEAVDLEAAGVRRGLAIRHVTPDAAGGLWISTEAALVQRAHDGTITMYLPVAAPGGVYRTVLDDAGRIWIATLADVRLLRPPVTPGSVAGVPLADERCGVAADGTLALPMAAGDSCRLDARHGLSPAPGRHGNVLLKTGDRVIIGAAGSLVEVRGNRLRPLARAAGDYALFGMAEGPDATLWLGTDAGLLRLAPEGPVLYGEADGLRHLSVVQVFGDDRDRIFVSTVDRSIHQFDGGRLRAARPSVPAPGLPQRPVYALDPSGMWWLATRGGVCQYTAPPAAEGLPSGRALRCYTTADGLASDDISHIGLDTKRTLWIGTRGDDGPRLTRRDPLTGRFDVLDVPGLTPASAAVDFATDRAGHTWVAFRDGGLARCTPAECRFAIQTPPVTDLHIDRSNRLWIATLGGVLRIDDTSSAAPRVTRVYTAQHGLSDNYIRALAADGMGRVYVATLAGIDRVDPSKDVIRRYSDADVVGSVTSLWCDSRNRLWAGGTMGLARYESDARTPVAPERPRIAWLRSGAREWPVAEFGEAAHGGIDLEPRHDTFEIAFFSLDLGRPPRLEYRLTDLDTWTTATADGRAVYSRVAPGRYRVEVRAVSEEGLTSAEVASIEFRVLRPVWQRWPAMLGAGSTIALGLYVAYRVRLRRMLAVERIRTRIATDLHDDIGSSLSQIAILAEVARRTGPAAAAEPLSAIATASRDLVDAMSDIVWAVNPRSDSLRDLTHRMRRFADEMLTGADIALLFSAPPEEHELRLGADIRREVYLILKESVTNIVRHSAASRVAIEFQVHASELRLTITDDGRGFDADTSTEGHGLFSMRKRAGRLGGALTIDTAPGRGTQVSLILNLRRSGARRYANA